MPSLFSRSRTNSTPKKTHIDPAFDEFGRINSRASGRGVSSPTPGSGKKEKKRDGKEKGRSRTVSSPAEQEPEFTIPDGSFLPLNLDPPQTEGTQQQPHPATDYGYLSYGRHVVLGLEEVARLVDVVGDELGTRGLTTPFIFSTLALGVSSSAVKRLIQAFLRTCTKPSAEAERQWREEAKFAGPHELGMCLRWGLARVVRIVRGNEVRGLISYENYVEWRDSEATLNYPDTHFVVFIEPLEPLLRSLLIGLLTLLTRFTAHSASSGHTPPTLSPLFGPLLFGLGPSTLAFHHAYVYYLRATIATEHLILSFIRWQDSPRAHNGASALGVPTRLKAWIQGYPAMLPTITKHDRPQPRRGARTVRVLSVRRNVRMYSPDLVKTAAGWAHRPRGAISPAGDRSFAGSKEWERVAPPTLKLPPRYSDNYKKRMDLPACFHPDVGAGSTASTAVPSLSSSISSTSSGTAQSMFDEKEAGRGARLAEERFRSLTDLKWGEFEAMGFGDLGADEKKLQFDLTEGARAARSAKRATLSWQDFSSSGFSRTDAPLNATLQFSTPVANTINSWPSHSAEIQRKLKKTQKGLPAFGWDTEPIIGAEEVVEEAFVDVFCDLIYGGGWMDIERCEETDRECNWALVEFKSLPVNRTTAPAPASDPRTSTTLFLFEEFVPSEYRQQLAANGTSRRRRLPNFFSAAAKSKQWKPATTLNGRPYVIGHVPPSPSYREVDFEGLLRANGSATKIISLNRTADERSPSSTVVTPGHGVPPAATGINPHLLTPGPRTDSRTGTPTSIRGGEGSAHPHRKSMRFRMPAGLPVSPAASKRTGMPPAEYDEVDFDTRIASFDEDSDAGKPSDKHARRRSKDDAWVDILVATSSRRMNGQAAELKVRKSDPELMSQEVSEVLAAVRSHMSSDDEDEIEPVHGLDDRDAHDGDDDETVEESVTDHARTPEPSSSHFADSEEDDDGAPPPIRQKRMGYFDLHPERRRQVSIGEDDQDQDQDPRQRFNRGSFESGDSRDGIEPVDVTAGPSSSNHDLHRQSMSTDADDDEDPTPNPSFVHPGFQHSSPLPSGDVPVYRAVDPLSLPSVNVTPPISQPSPNMPSPSTQSKTASLIEMYRAKELGARPAVSVPVSRLPVRALPVPPPVEEKRSISPLASTPSPRGSPLASTSSPKVSPKVSPRTSPAPPVAPPLQPEPEIVTPVTPSRYVHGAPLHNVLEEEEEEEE